MEKKVDELTPVTVTESQCDTRSTVGELAMRLSVKR